MSGSTSVSSVGDASRLDRSRTVSRLGLRPRTPYASPMEAQTISEERQSRERYAPLKTWAPIVISILALIISGLAFRVQAEGLNQQREQLETQRGQLETQRGQLNSQRDLLEAQQIEFKAAEERWRGEGPLLIARGYLRQGPEFALALLDFSENQADQELEAVWMDEGIARKSPTFIEVEVTNVGRSTGLITNVSGKMHGYALDSNLPGIWPCLVFGSGPNGEAPSPPGVCSAGFAEGDVICLQSDGGAATCRFPLQVPEATSVRVRLKLNDYFTENLSCKEGSLGGRVDVTINASSGPSLNSAFLASNSRGCPEGRSRGIKLLEPPPFK